MGTPEWTGGRAAPSSCSWPQRDGVLTTAFPQCPSQRGQGKGRLWSSCHCTLGTAALPLPPLHSDRVAPLDLALFHLLRLRGSAWRTSVSTDSRHPPQAFSLGSPPRSAIFQEHPASLQTVGVTPFPFCAHSTLRCPQLCVFHTALRGFCSTTT